LPVLAKDLVVAVAGEDAVGGAGGGSDVGAIAVTPGKVVAAAA
jgi:hypothetical protein